MSVSAMDIPIGSEFAGYRITSVLGRGGMSVVYCAEHSALGRNVALKLLSPMLAADETFRERFARESRMAATLDHPNIIPIYDAGEADGFLYIVMRHVEGSDLGSTIEQEGPLSLAQTLFYIEQVAGALDHAHEQGLVHRDIKPANILISKPSDRVYLTDFGVAKQTSSRGLTKTGFFLGTFEYAAPEQIEGREVDGRTDQYALGCVLYECLSGDAPFKGTTEASIIHAHLVEPPPRLTMKRADLPAAINDVVYTALAKAKEDRYSSCGDFTRALRSIAMSGTVAQERPAQQPAMPASPATVLATPDQQAQAGDAGGAAAPPAGPGEPPAPPVPAAPAGEPRAPRGLTLSAKRLALIGGIIAALIAVAIIAAVLMSGGDEKKKGGTTGSNTTAGNSAVGFAAVIPNDLFKFCDETKGELGASLQADCKSPATGTTFFPDTWQLSLFTSDADALKAYDTLRKQNDIGQNFGTCSGIQWGPAEGIWRHNPETPGTLGKRAGRRFCYFEGNVAVIVWTHDKLGQESHIPLLAIARASGSDHASLFSWWRFWHHRLGKCTTPNCVAKLS